MRSLLEQRGYLLPVWNRRRRVALGLLAGAFVLAEPNASHAAGQVYRNGRSHTFGDFDGDGLLDRAFGYPQAHGNQGSTVIVYGNGEIQELHRGSPGILDVPGDDYFGDSVSAGDIDGDGYDDLVVGVPRDDITVFGVGGSVTYADAGSIHVIYGSDQGLTGTGDQIMDRVSDGLDASVDGYDRFGASVAVADFNCDGREDVAVGVPLDDAHTGRSNDGSIHVIYGTPTGLSSADDFFHQGTPDVSGAPESYDEFGASVAVGDFDGQACMDLAVGVVGENTDGGYVVFFYGAAGGNLDYANQTGLHQNLSNAEDQIESDDEFGAQMWAFDDNGDAYDDLMVAAPGEVCNNGRSAGYHQFRGHWQGIVSGNLLSSSVDALECMGWNEGSVQNAIEDYAWCMDIADPDCGEALTTDFLDLGRDTATANVTMCDAAIEYALDACEHWISDPICDVDLCIAAAHELDAVGVGCAQEGDVITDAYTY